jgi:hypothetical protein
MDDDSTDTLESAIERVESAVARVETAIKEKWSTAQWVVVMFIGVFLWSLPGTIWHARWRYAAAYSIPSPSVYVQDKPHDCAFLAAPLGEKYCHYERTISITRWASSLTGTPIVSYDDGKTWSSFDPAGEKVPQYSTVKEVYIGWEKKED